MSFKKPVLNLCKRKINGFKCTLLYIIPQEVNKYNGLVKKSTILNALLILYRFGGILYQFAFIHIATNNR